MNNDATSHEPTRIEMLLVPTSLIDRDPDQIRRDWRSNDATAHRAELTASVREYGLLQPVVLRPHPEYEGRFLTIAGARRLLASHDAGLEEVPALVRQVQGTEAYLLQLTENLQRQELEPMDEARAYDHLMKSEGWSAPQLAERIHRSVQHVRERIRLLRDAVLSEALEAGRITPTAAREIKKASDEVQDALRWRVQRGEAITIEKVDAIKAELTAAGIQNPRNTKPATEEATQAPGDLARQQRVPPIVPPSPRVKLVLEETEAGEPAPPPGPQRARPRPDPFDTVRRRGDESDVRFGDPEHIVVERPPSPYGRVVPRTPEAQVPGAQQGAADEPTPAAAAKAEDGSQVEGISALNRAEAIDADDREYLRAYLLRLEWDALQGVLLYGVERGWSCASLYSHVLALVR